MNMHLLTHISHLGSHRAHGFCSVKVVHLSYVDPLSEIDAIKQLGPHSGTDITAPSLESSLLTIVWGINKRDMVRVW